MRCGECDAHMRTRRENYRYDESGLSGVTLMDVEVSRCPDCGYEEVVIPRMADLHRTIARALVEKPTRLVPAEIRYLRKHLGWSQADFAAVMGVHPSTVSRWETGAQTMEAANDRLLRLLVHTQRPVPDYQVESLKDIREEAIAARVGLTIDASGWHYELAA